MLKRKKKVLSLLLALALILPLAACGGSQTNGTTGTDTTKGTGESNETSEDTGNGGIDTSEFVSINMLVLGNKPTNGRMEAALAAENEIFKERINAELSLQYIEWTDWQTNYQLTLARGDGSIDLVITATDWLYAWQLVEKGAFLGMDKSMLEQYAPKTFAAVPDEHWAETMKDGKIWFIPEDQFTQWTNHGMYYRNDWAKEAGITEPITTFEQLEAYYDGVLENHEGVIPWDIGASNNLPGLLPGYIQNAIDATFILGTETGAYGIFYYDNSDPYTVISPYMDDDVLIDAAVTFDRWAEKGFWREDVLNYTGETRDLMYAGTSASDQHHTQTYVTTTRPNMDEKQPGSDLQMFYWGAANGNVNRDLITHGAMAVSSSSPNPERALMLYDLLRNDEELYRLHNYGIEGVDYIVNENGTLGRPEGYDPTTDSLDTNFWGGRMDEFELEQDFWYDGRLDFFAQLDAVADSYKLSKFAFEQSAVAAEMAALTEVCNQYLTSIAYGKTADPVTAVEEFRAAMKAAGYDKVLAEIQSQLDALKAEG